MSCIRPEASKETVATNEGSSNAVSNCCFFVICMYFLHISVNLIALFGVESHDLRYGTAECISAVQCRRTLQFSYIEKIFIHKMFNFFFNISFSCTFFVSFDN